MKFYICKPVLWVIVGFVLGVFSFWIVDHLLFSSVQNSPQNLVTESNKYPHVRPIVLPWDTDADRAQELVPFRQIIEDKISEYTKNKKASKVAYYFRDLNNGPWFGINLDTEFRLASLLKVPVMMSYFRLAEQDRSALNKKLVFDGIATNRIDNNKLTKPSDALVKGKSYTVEELIEKMIIDSDNDAFKLLVNNIDIGLLADPYNLSEIQIQSKDQDYMSTLRQYSTFFRALYNASYLSRAYSEKALNILISSNFKKGLPAGIPTTIPVAHKFGIRQTDEYYQLHDCGIVYYPNNPYLLCIMTEGKSLDDLVGVIKGLSFETYKEVRGQISQK